MVKRFVYTFVLAGVRLILCRDAAKMSQSMRATPRHFLSMPAGVSLADADPPNRTGCLPGLSPAGRTENLVGQLRHIVADGFSELFGGKILGCGEISSPQVRAFEIDGNQACPDEIGTSQIRLTKIRTLQVGHAQIRAAEVAAREVSKDKVRPVQVRVCEVRPEAGIRLSPSVPFVNVGLQRCCVLRIRH